MGVSKKSAESTLAIEKTGQLMKIYRVMVDQNYLKFSNKMQSQLYIYIYIYTYTYDMGMCLRKHA